MSSEDNRPPQVTMDDVLGGLQRRVGMEERRPRVTKAADVLGPSLGPYAVRLNNLNDDMGAFNGMWLVPPGSLGAPDTVHWWAGFTIANNENGGHQYASTFRPTDQPFTQMVRGWSVIPGTGTRVYTTWETIGGEPPDTAVFGLWKTQANQSVTSGTKATLGAFYEYAPSTSVGIDAYVTLNTDAGRGVWTFHTPGVYAIKCKIKWDASSSGHRYIYARIDNSEVDNISAAPGNGAMLTLTYEFELLGLNADQDVRFQTMQNSGGTRQIVGSPDGFDTSVSIRRVGDLPEH